MLNVIIFVIMFEWLMNIYIYSEYMKLLLTQVEKVQCISGILIRNEKNVEKLLEKTLWWYLAKYNIFLYFSNFFLCFNLAINSYY